MNDDQSEGQPTGVDSLSPTLLQGTPDTALGSDIQAKIGQHLRAMYDDVVRQGVPDRFMDLLAQLDDKSPPKASDDSGGTR